MDKTSDPLVDNRTTPTSDIEAREIADELRVPHTNVNLNDWRVRHLAGRHGGAIDYDSLKGRNARFSIKTYVTGGGLTYNIYSQVRGAPPYCPVSCYAELAKSHRAYLKNHGTKTGQADRYGNLDLYLGQCVLESWATGEESSDSGSATIRHYCTAMNITRSPSSWVNVG